MHGPGRDQGERGHRPGGYAAGPEPAGSAGCRGRCEPQRGGAAECRLLPGKPVDQGLQGPGLRLPGWPGRCRCPGGGADRSPEPQRQAGRDLGLPLRRHPGPGKLWGPGPHRGIPGEPVCGLPLLRHRRGAHGLPLWLRPQLHQLCLQRPAGRRPGRYPDGHQHRQLCRCRGGAAVCGKA